MKILLAALLIAFTGAVSADWEDVFQNPDLSDNHAGLIIDSGDSIDPVATAYQGNQDVFAGHEAGDVIEGDLTPSSLARFYRGNTDAEYCGCI